MKRQPQRNEYIFNNGPMEHFAQNYRQQRKTIAFKLNSPRTTQVSFKTFRHFKGTMEYHRTKDILHVKYVLGHINIKNKLVYTHLMKFSTDEFHTKIARNADEACKLVEVGFEFVCSTPITC